MQDLILLVVSAFSIAEFQVDELVCLLRGKSTCLSSGDLPYPLLRQPTPITLRNAILNRQAHQNKLVVL